MGWRRGDKGFNWESGKAEMLVKKGEGDKRELEKESSREIKAVVDYRRVKFGEEEVRKCYRRFGQAREGSQNDGRGDGYRRQRV